MDHNEIKSIWDAFQAVQEKKLSDKQKALDVDNDGDIEGDDLADLRNKKNKADVVEEVPTAHNKKAPARKGDKSNAMPNELKKEEVEQVDEISQGLKNRYVQKAAMSAVSNAHSDGVSKTAGAKGKHKDKVLNRLRGINRATKESVEESAWLQDLAVILQGLEEKKDEHTKGATAPETIAGKESNKSKDFIDMHKKSDKEWEDKEEQGHDDVSKAGRATKAAAGRKSDQLKNGDKAIVKPVAKK